jgi:hypothetical protein
MPDMFILFLRMDTRVSIPSKTAKSYILRISYIERVKISMFDATVFTRRYTGTRVFWTFG